MNDAFSYAELRYEIVFEFSFLFVLIRSFIDRLKNDVNIATGQSETVPERTYRQTDRMQTEMGN